MLENARREEGGAARKTREGKGEDIGKGRGGEGEFKNMSVEGSANRDEKEGNGGEWRTEERGRG